MMKNIIALVSGILFGIGLVISGMTDTHVILGFLDVFGQWNPALLFVMIAGLIMTIPAFHFILKQQKPVFTNEFCLPINKVIDKKLIIGSIIFGIGWGLYGYCPGPAISALTYVNTDTFLFVASMLIGIFMASRIS